MSESLIIDVDIPTQRAVENLQQLTQGLEHLDSGVAQADQKITKAEVAIEDLGRAAVQTAAAVDGMAKKTETATYEVQEIGKATLSVSEKLADLKEKYSGAGDAARDFGKKAEGAADDAAAKTDGLSGSVLKLGAAYQALHVAVGIMKELTDQTNRVIAAREELTQEKIAYDSQLKQMAINLGTDQTRTRAIGVEFQKRVGNPNVELTTSVISAVANGFTGQDVTDPNGAAFSIAVSAGRFAQRTGVSPKAMGDILKGAAANGVTDSKGMDAFLAKVEAGFRNTDIPRTPEFTEAAASLLAKGAAQKVPVEQSLGLLAAASGGEVDASVMASRVTQLNESLHPAELKFAGRLGLHALKHGVISEADVNRGIARFKELNPKYEGDRARTRQKEESRLENARAIYEENIHAIPVDIHNEEVAVEDLAASVALEEASPHKHKRADERARAALAIQHRKDELNTRRDKLKKAKELAPLKLAQEKRKLDDAKLLLQTANADAETDLRFAGMQHALETVPQADLQSLVFKMTEGKEGPELGQMLGEFMPQSYAQNLVTIFGAKGRKAFVAAMNEAGSAKGGEVTEKNRAYYTGDEALRNRSLVTAQQEKIAAVGSGEEVASGILAEGEARLAIEKNKGKGGFGFFTNLANGNAATSELGAKGLQTAQVLRERILGLWNQMTPAQRRRHPEFKRFMDVNLSEDIIAGKGETSIAEVEIGARSHMEETAFNNLRTLAAEFARMQKSILSDPTEIDADSLPLPAGAVRNGQTFGSATQGVVAGLGGVAGGITVIHHHTMNQHVASQFFGGGDDDDMPGRLEGR